MQIYVFMVGPGSLTGVGNILQIFGYVSQQERKNGKAVTLYWHPSVPGHLIGPRLFRALSRSRVTIKGPKTGKKYTVENFLGVFSVDVDEARGTVRKVNHGGAVVTRGLDAANACAHGLYLLRTIGWVTKKASFVSPFTGPFRPRDQPDPAKLAAVAADCVRLRRLHEERQARQAA